MNTQDRNLLEAMIDKHGLQAVVAEIATICGEKAVHIAENWQDPCTAKVWDKACNALSMARNRLK